MVVVKREAAVAHKTALPIIAHCFAVGTGRCAAFPTSAAISRVVVHNGLATIVLAVIAISPPALAFEPALTVLACTIAVSTNGALHVKIATTIHMVIYSSSICTRVDMYTFMHETKMQALNPHNVRIPYQVYRKYPGRFANCN